MEKILRSFLAALAALTALTGCRHVEQEVPEAAAVKTVRFHAGTTKTRTAFAEAVNGVYQTLWTGNDSEVLLSLNYGKAEASAVTPSADGTTASFAASFDAGSASSPYIFYAVSPASAARAISPSRQAWSVCIATEQSPSALSVDEDAQLLVAKSAASATLPDEVDLHFSHLTAYGRISLNNLELGEAVVQKVELVFSVPVVGEWYWSEDGEITENGASHTITLTTDASSDLWFACAPVDVSGATMRLDIYTSQGMLTKEITFPEGRKFTSGKVARFSVDMAGITFIASDVYTLVTQASDLVAGCEVIFLNDSGNRAMGPQKGNYREALSNGFVLSGNQVELSEGQVATFTVGAGNSAGTYSFHDVSGYLAATSSNSNYLKTQLALNNYSSWQLSFYPDGSVLVSALAGERNKLRYNPSSPRFSCYKSGQDAVKLYMKGTGPGSPVDEDPLTAFSEYGCYISGATRTYVRGTDQLLRSYAGNELEFVLVKASEKEQLVVSGYDPSLHKGSQVTVSVSYRKGLTIYLNQSYTLTVVKEDGPKVWLGDGSGQGFIIKK